MSAFSLQESWEDVEHMLRVFRDATEADVSAELVFSSTLSKWQRASIHGCAAPTTSAILNISIYLSGSGENSGPHEECVPTIHGSRSS